MWLLEETRGPSGGRGTVGVRLQKEMGPDHTVPQKPESCPVSNREPWKGLKMGMDMIRFAF